MINPDAPNFNPGGVKDRVDTRDFQFSEIGFGTAPFDWSVGYDVEKDINAILTIKDQNGSFSCGGQSWGQYAAALEAYVTKTFEERSAKFFYAQTYQNGGGSSGRDNATIYINQGAARESVLTSYENGKPPSEAFITRGQDITQAARDDAKYDKALSYAQVGNDIDTVAQAIRDNRGAVIGFTAQNNGTWLSAFPKPPKDSHGLWNHWVYAGRAKMINGKKHIGFANSWGVTAGDKGWQWLSEDYFKTKVAGVDVIWSVWTHIYNSANPPLPTFHHNFAIDMQFGATGDEVVALQTALQIDGEFPKSVPTSGFFGTVTQNAVKAFQIKYKISPVQGNVGPLTRKQLNVLFNT